VGVCEQAEKKVLVHYGKASLLAKALNYIENCENMCMLSCFESADGAVEYAKESRLSKVVEVTASGISEVWSE